MNEMLQKVWYYFFYCLSYNAILNYFGLNYFKMNFILHSLPKESTLNILNFIFILGSQRHHGRQRLLYYVLTERCYQRLLGCVELFRSQSCVFWILGMLVIALLSLLGAGCHVWLMAYLPRAVLYSSTPLLTLSHSLSVIYCGTKHIIVLEFLIT